MTVTADPPADGLLTAHVRDRLAGPTPLALADLKKGAPKPPKGKRGGPKPDLDALLRVAVADAERDGSAFGCPSGKGGAVRYWHRDEAEAVRQAVLAAATEPRTLAELRKAGAAGLRADGGFVDGLVRGLIADDRLFEHPAKTKAGGPRFGVTAPPPPPPPLSRGKFPKQVGDLAKKVATLVAAAGVSVGDVLEAVRLALGPAADGPADPPAAADLDGLILAAVSAGDPVQSLASVRGAMPVGLRGPAFDAAVLRLAAAKRVRLDQDGEPLHYPPDVQAGFVRDAHGNVYTNVSIRGGE